ncbi:MAG: hypothetical protein Q9164_007619 [Protoblastenia rupestris]
MAVTGDLIDFDIIETHKENIQALPGGRSAKALASTFAPGGRTSGSTPNETRNLNDAIREEYEIELNAIAESDDPLDIYDRYVKWTLGAYPSAQATPESQLRPLLERATKAFQSTGDYKNDPRYLKLWLTYIRLFSDAPKETFVYLARHNIGERLALFYEEFAAWLEGALRWAQAEEVYALGLEREARPVERLQRKYGEFKARYDALPQSETGPSSPALPTMRPALATKVDPFALSTPRSMDSQAQRPVGGMSTTKGGKPKMAIFSDTEAPESALKASMTEGSRGWDNIGSISGRKKENMVEAKPWIGETLKAGKKINGPPKMAIFKDTVSNSH